MHIFCEHLIKKIRNYKSTLELFKREKPRVNTSMQFLNRIKSIKFCRLFYETQILTNGTCTHL